MNFVNKRKEGKIAAKHEKKFLVFLSSLVFIFLILSTSAFATKSPIAGAVKIGTDPYFDCNFNQPIAGATVEAIRQSDGVVVATDTSMPSTGSYTLWVEGNDWYSVRASKDGKTYTVRNIYPGQSGSTVCVPLNLPPPPTNKPPVAKFTATPSSASAPPLTVSFDGSYSSDPDGQINSYYWVFDDGETLTSTSSMTTHTYTKSGDFFPSLTVADNSGAKSSPYLLKISIGTPPTTSTTTTSSTTTTTLNQPPSAEFDVSHPDRYDTLTLKFDASRSSDTDGNIVSYSWNFGDGKTGEGKIISHTYAAPGNYEISLIVKDDKGATGTAKKVWSVEACVSKDYSLVQPAAFSEVIFDYYDQSTHKLVFKVVPDVTCLRSIDVLITVAPADFGNIIPKPETYQVKMNLTDEDGDQFYEGTYDFSKFIKEDSLIKGQRIYGIYRVEILGKATWFRVASDFDQDGKPDPKELTELATSFYYAAYQNLLGSCGLSIYPGTSVPHSIGKMFLSGGAAIYWKDFSRFIELMKEVSGDIAIDIIGQIIKVENLPGYICVANIVGAVGEEFGAPKSEADIIVMNSPADLVLKYKNGTIANDGSLKNILYSGPDSHPEILVVFYPDNYDLTILGTGVGTMTVNLTNITSNVMGSALYSDIPVNEKTKGFVDLKKSLINYTMALDKDSDGIIDEYKEPDSINKTVLPRKEKIKANFTFEPANPTTADTIKFFDRSVSEGSILTYKKPAGAHHYTFKKDNPILDNSKGTTMEARLKVLSGGMTYGYPDNSPYGATLDIRDGKKYADVVMNESAIRMFNEIKSFDTKSDFHTYRLTLKGDVANLYVDGKLLISTTAQPYSYHFLLWGIATSSWTGYGESLWDYVKYTTEGAFEPGAETSSWIVYDGNKLPAEEGWQISTYSTEKNLQTAAGGITSWLWDFGDRENSTLQNPTHNYKSEGNYTVLLTIENSGGEKDSAFKNLEISKANASIPLSVKITHPPEGSTIKTDYVNVLASTNKDAVCYMRLAPVITWGGGYFYPKPDWIKMEKTGGTEHSHTVSNLFNRANYRADVKCEDYLSGTALASVNFRTDFEKCSPPITITESASTTTSTTTTTTIPPTTTTTQKLPTTTSAPIMVYSDIFDELARQNIDGSDKWNNDAQIKNSFAITNNGTHNFMKYSDFAPTKYYKTTSKINSIPKDFQVSVDLSFRSGKPGRVLAISDGNPCTGWGSSSELCSGSASSNILYVGYAPNGPYYNERVRIGSSNSVSKNTGVSNEEYNGLDKKFHKLSIRKVGTTITFLKDDAITSTYTDASIDNVNWNTVAVADLQSEEIWIDNFIVEDLT